MVWMSLQRYPNITFINICHEKWDQIGQRNWYCIIRSKVEIMNKNCKLGNKVNQSFFSRIKMFIKELELDFVDTGKITPSYMF